jgi:hypothetical protein
MTTINKIENKTLVNRTLVGNEKTIPLKIIKISPESQTVYDNTVIAKVSPVYGIPSADRNLMEKQSHEITRMQVSSVVSDHWINVYETCITYLSAIHMLNVQKRLILAFFQNMTRTMVELVSSNIRQNNKI